MDIIYLGHSSFKLKGRTATVVCDPYDKYVGFKFPATEADIVTISHHHDDHDKAELVSGVKKVVDGPGEYEIMGVSILGFSAYHDDRKGEERGVNTIYVIEMDGLRLCHLGDLGHSLSEQQLEQIGTVDILFIPVGGVYTIDAKTAVEVASAIDPKIIIPMHYNLAGLDQAKFAGLSGVNDFVNQMGVKSETLPKLTYKPGDLPEEEQRVYILEVK